MSAVETYVGQPLPRVEDLRLPVGAGSYGADIDREGQLHARVVRSDLPLGRLNGINAVLSRCPRSTWSRTLPGERFPSELPGSPIACRLS